MTRFARRFFTSPLVGEVDREAIGRGVLFRMHCVRRSPPTLTLPHKGGGKSGFHP